MSLRQSLVKIYLFTIHLYIKQSRVTLDTKLTLYNTVLVHDYALYKSTFYLLTYLYK